MKVLFICWRNVSRSQMAAAYYNHLTGSHDADSAGTSVEVNGETLAERRNRVGGTVAIDLAAREGWDISHNQETQLTKDILDRYDLIISMADKSITPAWLSGHKNYRYWNVPDPGASNLEILAEAFEVIKQKVRELTSSGATSQRR
jgi:arsenate reductase